METQPILGKNDELAGGASVVVPVTGKGYGACRRDRLSSMPLSLLAYHAARGDTMRDENASNTRGSGTVSEPSPNTWVRAPGGVNSMEKSRKPSAHGLA